MAKDRDLELSRIRRRPVDPPPTGLLAWEIDTIEDPHEYAVRLRSCLTSTLSIARRTDFDAEEVPVDGLPAWIVGVTEGNVDGGAIPRACKLGRQRYYEHRDERQWSLQEWLFCFDPELRHWEWWDLTRDDDRVTLWVDSSGEPVFAAEELMWMVFAAGANDVRKLGVLPARRWMREPSLGVWPGDSVDSVSQRRSA